MAADMQFGQPLHETHPHLLAAGELTPGITALEYHQRRAALARRLPKNSVAILAASNVKYRSGAVFYEFHQEPNFFYLTGFTEPDALAVIEKGDSDAEYTFHLYVRPKDDRAETWDGARSGVQAAQDVFNADEAGDINDAPLKLPDLIQGAKEIYTDLGNNQPRSPFERFLKGSNSNAPAFQKLLQSSQTRPLNPIMNRLRLTKSPAELTNMRLAGAISGAAFSTAMSQSYTTEKALWNDLSYSFKAHGLDGDAYVPVVAGGQNALMIHYVRNDNLLPKDEMVLVDAGGEYGGYITDITRTWPVNGRFSEPQRELYEMLLGVQTKCLTLCKESEEVSLDSLHHTSEALVRDGLRGLGFPVAASANSFSTSSQPLDALYPHHVGHFIGLDVHDAPGHPRTEKLQANQCITIEPGVYVPDDDRWPAAFRGIGIRIEDSVVIGKGKDDGEILTANAAKTVEEIESLRV
ncbi:hypothetical protein MBLNU230_g6356t2 [Neophaeotheca triangularis]